MNFEKLPSRAKDITRETVQAIGNVAAYGVLYVKDLLDIAVGNSPNEVTAGPEPPMIDHFEVEACLEPENFDALLDELQNYKSPETQA